MSLVEIAADASLRDERIMNVHKFCSPELVSKIKSYFFHALDTLFQTVCIYFAQFVFRCIVLHPVYFNISLKFHKDESSTRTVLEKLSKRVDKQARRSTQNFRAVLHIARICTFVPTNIYLPISTNVLKISIGVFSAFGRIIVDDDDSVNLSLTFFGVSSVGVFKWCHLRRLTVKMHDDT